jgi:ribonuclease MRP protein subunit RMP1
MSRPPRPRPKPNPNPTPELSIHKVPTPPPTVLQKLQTINQTLHLLHHRNKNQHRRSKWYKYFSLLRRHLCKLAFEICELKNRETQPILKLSTFSAPGAGVAAAKEAADREERIEFLRERIEQRKSFLRSVVVPGAYLAFSNLVGEKQFGHLGVVLVGMLGEVAALVEFQGEESGDGGGGREEWEGFGETEDEVDRRKSGGEDLGEVVERTKVVFPIGKAPKEEIRRKGEGLLLGKAEEEGGGDVEKERKKKTRKKGDAIDELFSGLD